MIVVPFILERLLTSFGSRRPSTRFNVYLSGLWCAVLGAFILLRVNFVLLLSSSTLDADPLPLVQRLTCFALSLDYGKIIPTVNVHTAASRDKMKEWMTRWVLSLASLSFRSGLILLVVRRWMQEKKRRAAAKIPLMVPHRATTYW